MGGTHPISERSSDFETAEAIEDVTPGTADFSLTAQRGSATKATPVKWDGAPRPLHRSTPRPSTKYQSREVRRLASHNRPGLKEGGILASNLRSGKRKSLNLSLRTVLGEKVIVEEKEENDGTETEKNDGKE